MTKIDIETRNKAIAELYHDVVANYPSMRAYAAERGIDRNKISNLCRGKVTRNDTLEVLLGYLPDPEKDPEYERYRERLLAIFGVEPETGAAATEQPEIGAAATEQPGTIELNDLIANAGDYPGLTRRYNALRAFFRADEEIPMDLLIVLSGGNNDLLADLVKAAGKIGVEITGKPYCNAIINHILRPVSLKVRLEKKKFSELVLLDPENPRFCGKIDTSKSNREVQDAASAELEKDARSLVRAIREGGYLGTSPIIVVPKNDKTDSPYVAVEGNTRVVAINKILTEQETSNNRIIDPAIDIRISELAGLTYDDSEYLRHTLMRDIHISGTKDWSAYHQAKELAYAVDKRRGINDVVDKCSAGICKLSDDASRGTRLSSVRAVKQLEAYHMLSDLIETVKRPQQLENGAQLVPIEGPHDSLISLFSEMQDKRAEAARKYFEDAEHPDNALHMACWMGMCILVPEGEDPEDMQIPAIPPISGTHAIKNLAIMLKETEKNKADREDLIQKLDKGTHIATLLAEYQACSSPGNTFAKTIKHVWNKLNHIDLPGAEDVNDEKTMTALYSSKDRLIVLAAATDSMKAQGGDASD